MQPVLPSPATLGQGEAIVPGSFGNPVDELMETAASESPSPASLVWSATLTHPAASFLDSEEEELPPPPEVGGGRRDRSGESASRAALRSLSLAVTAIATIGSVSRGPAKLKSSAILHSLIIQKNEK